MAEERATTGKNGKARASAPAGARIGVDTRADSRDLRPGDGRCADRRGRCSLRGAIQEANTRKGGTRIVLRGGSYKLSIAGSGEDRASRGDLDVRTNVTVVGRNSAVDASRVDRAFDVTAAGSLRVIDLRIARGAPASGESGGAIKSAGSTVLLRARLNRNAVRGDGASGGAVFNDGGRLVVRESWLFRNRAVRAGGAIEANAGTTAIQGGMLNANQAGSGPGNGGALHVTGEGKVGVRDARIVRNVAAAEGGGLWNSASGTMRVIDSQLVGNKGSGDEADQGGGALYNDGGSLTVEDVAINRNQADGDAGSGGGILNNTGDLEVTDSRISGNQAVRAGGAVEAVDGSTDLSRVRLVSNSAGSGPGNGGGLHITGEGNVWVGDSFVVANFASAEGGGLWNSAGSTMRVARTTFLGNRAGGDDADQGGGALYNDGGELTVEAGAIAENVASGDAGSGGGLLNNEGQLTVIGTDVSRNISARAGGGVEAVAGTTTLSDVDLRDNGTGASPGNGGGLHLSGEGTVNIDGSRVVRNTATKEGGGLWNSAVGTMTVTDTTIDDNSAPDGADVYNQPPGGDFTVDGMPVLAG